MENTPEKQIVSIVARDGSIDEVEVVLSFEFTDTKKEYLIYTKNEKDDNGNITLYVANVKHVDGKTELDNIESDEEWNRIKDVLREIAKAEVPQE